MRILIQLFHFSLHFLKLLFPCNHARWCYSLAYEEVMLHHSRQRDKSFCSLFVSPESTFGCMFDLLFALQFCSLGINYPNNIWDSHYPSVLYFFQIIFTLKFTLALSDNCHCQVLPLLIYSFSFAWFIWGRWLSRKYIHKIKMLDEIPFSESPCSKWITGAIGIAYLRKTIKLEDKKVTLWPKSLPSFSFIIYMPSEEGRMRKAYNLKESIKKTKWNKTLNT